MDALREWYFKTMSFGVETDVMNTYPHSLPFGAVVLYLLAIFVILPRVVPPKGYRNTLWLKCISATWNLFLSLLSVGVLVGMLVPYYEMGLAKKGFYRSLCDEERDLYVVS